MSPTWADPCGQFGRNWSKVINILDQTDKDSPSQTQDNLLNARRIYQNNVFPESASNILFVTTDIGIYCL